MMKKKKECRGGTLSWEEAGGRLKSGTHPRPQHVPCFSFRTWHVPQVQRYCRRYGGGIGNQSR